MLETHQRGQTKHQLCAQLLMEGKDPEKTSRRQRGEALCQDGTLSPATAFLERPVARASGRWQRSLPWRASPDLRDPGVYPRKGRQNKPRAYAVARVTSYFGMLQKPRPQGGSNCTKPSPEQQHPGLCLHRSGRATSQAATSPRRKCRFHQSPPAPLLRQSLPGGFCLGQVLLAQAILTFS